MSRSGKTLMATSAAGAAKAAASSIARRLNSSPDEPARCVRYKPSAGITPARIANRKTTDPGRNIIARAAKAQPATAAASTY